MAIEPYLHCFWLSVNMYLASY